MLKTALVVDDDFEVQVLISEMLSEHGFVCMGASNAQGALQYGAELANVDVVFTDLKMPGMNGFELIGALRQKKLKCPIVGVTGLENQGAELSANLDKGCLPDLTVAKPFRFEMIQQILDLLKAKDLVTQTKSSKILMELGL